MGCENFTFEAHTHRNSVSECVLYRDDDVGRESAGARFVDEKIIGWRNHVGQYRARGVGMEYGRSGIDLNSGSLHVAARLV